MDEQQQNDGQDRIRTLYHQVQCFYESHTILSFLLVAFATLALDYATGKNIQFPIFYALPVGILAWNSYSKGAYIAAIFLPLIRVWFNFVWNDNESITHALVNALINMAALVLYSYLFCILSEQAKMLAKRVRVLEGILPTCDICKKIRNEQGEYEPAEKYISEHTEAQFSHGICPECAKEFYPQYIRQKMKAKTL